MTIVKDIDGNVLKGIKKDSLGNITVKNDMEYRKYLHSKEQMNRINKLCNDVEDLKQLIQQLINKQKD